MAPAQLAPAPVGGVRQVGGLPAPDTRPAALRPGPVTGLAQHRDRTALIGDGAAVSYAELAERVSAATARLGSTRRLVLLAMGSSVDAVVTYLAALAGGHPVLLTRDDDGTVAGLTAAYDPDVVARPGSGAEWLSERRHGTVHELHPDLALLLSTSGSTGSPKLVRLSHENLLANTRAIATYLGVRPEDRAVTALPLHYCYGLSVLNTHLLRGAAVVLSDRSVADPAFWDLMRRHRVTSLAGVPFTFDLLDVAGFADEDLPHLRYVTQAGGRLAPEQVRRYAELGRLRGWDLFVMYGQTEATARMAYLPPDRALTDPHAVGLPIPGGAFHLRPVDDAPDGVGELVYTGPNVMLGYAECPSDLALGRTVTQLATGDLGRRTSDGLWEVVGRTGRFAKLYGLRVDLDHLEASLAGTGCTAAVVEINGALHVLAEHPAEPEDVRRRVAAAAGLPVTAVRAEATPALPRLANGKPDRAAVTAAAPARARQTPAPSPADGPALLDRLAAAYAEVLDVRHVGPDDTFTGLGGDSLSYVEATVRLEQHLGRLPVGWHDTPLRDLAARIDAVPTPDAAAGRAVDTSVVLRAVAIVLIAASHADVLDTRGGAHVLLAVAGYNLARFRLTDESPARRCRSLLRSAARVAIPSVVWISAMLVVTDRYLPVNAALVHNFVGPDSFDDSWAYWFVEVLVWTLLGAAVLARVPVLHRAERAAPFGTAAVVLAIGLAFRFEVVVLDTGPDRIHTLHHVLWLFALGWAAARATSSPQRVALSATVLVSTWGWFSTTPRTAIVVVGLLLLIWCRTLRVPSRLVAPLAVLATSSLYIYLTHFQVYRQFDEPALGLAASLVVGVAAARAAAGLSGATSRLTRSLRSRTMRQPTATG